jgi:hypothetical protein
VRVIDIDKYRREMTRKENPSGAFSRMQLAGWLILSLPASIFAVAWLNDCFHFIPPGPVGGNHTDLGVLLLIWFGIGLACNRRGYIMAAKIMCGMYLGVFTALAVLGLMFQDWPASHGWTSTLTIIVPIASPKMWHYLLLELIALAFFGAPLYLLSRRPGRPVFGQAV